MFDGIDRSDFLHHSLFNGFERSDDGRRCSRRIADFYRRFCAEGRLPVSVIHAAHGDEVGLARGQITNDRAACRDRDAAALQVATRERAEVHVIPLELGVIESVPRHIEELVFGSHTDVLDLDGPKG